MTVKLEPGRVVDMSDNQRQNTAKFGLFKNAGSLQTREIITIEAAIVFQKDSHSTPVNSCYEEQDRQFLPHARKRGPQARDSAISEFDHTFDAIMQMKAYRNIV